MHRIKVLMHGCAATVKPGTLSQAIPCRRKMMEIITPPGFGPSIGVSMGVQSTPDCNSYNCSLAFSALSDMTVEQAKKAVRADVTAQITEHELELPVNFIDLTIKDSKVVHPDGKIESKKVLYSEDFGKSIQRVTNFEEKDGKVWQVTNRISDLVVRAPKETWFVAPSQDEQGGENHRLSLFHKQNHNRVREYFISVNASRPAFERIIESISTQPSVYSSDGISVIRDDINNDSPFSLRTVYKIVENSYDRSERKERTTFLKQLKTDTHYSPEELEKRNTEIKHFVHEYVDKVLSDEISFSAIGLVGQGIAELARKVSAKIEVAHHPHEESLSVVTKDEPNLFHYRNYSTAEFEGQHSKQTIESANDHKFPLYYSLTTENMEDTDKFSPPLLLRVDNKNIEDEKEESANSVRKSFTSDEKIVHTDNSITEVFDLHYNDQNKGKKQEVINSDKDASEDQSIKGNLSELTKRKKEKKELRSALVVGLLLWQYQTIADSNNTEDKSNLDESILNGEFYQQEIEEPIKQVVTQVEPVKEIHSLVIPAVVLLIEEIIEEGKAEADSTVFSPVTGESVLMLSENGEELNPDFEEIFWEDLLLTIALTDFINIANQRERSYRDKSQEDKIFSDIFITPEEENSALQGENGEKSHSILKLELFLKELSELINEDETEGKVDVRTENQKDKELENHALHQEIMTLDLKILIELIKQDQETEMINDTMISLLINSSAYKSSYFDDRVRSFLSLFTLKESEQVFRHRHNKEDVTSENELLLNKFLTVLNTNSVVEFLSQKNNLLEKEIDPHEKILEELKEYQNKHLLNNNKQSEKSKESKFDSEDDSELKAINIIVLLLLLEMKQKKINFKELELSKHQPHHSAKDVLIRLYKIFNTLGYQRGEQELLLNILGTSQDIINDWIKLRIEVQSVNQKANNKLLKLERNLFCRIWLNRMVGNILRSNKNKKKKAVSGSVQIFGTFCLCGLIFRYKPLALNIIDVSEYSIITSN